MKATNIRPATTAQAGDIAAIMAAGMSAKVRRITILGSPLLHAYIAGQLTSATGDAFLVAEVEGRVVGVAGWRRLGGTLMLNHLYVQPEARGQGVGRALLADGLQRGSGEEAQSVAVDVFSESPRTRAWYVALGMTPQYRRVWLETPLPSPRSMSAGQCNVDGMEQADLDHARLGFSQFKLITFTAEYGIGRLADGVFRSVGFGILHDRHALAALATLDARRTLVCLGPPEELPPDALRAGRIVEESERLSVPYPALRARCVPAAFA